MTPDDSKRLDESGARPESGDVEALATLIQTTSAYYRPGRGITDKATAGAEAILASDWLAEYVRSHRDDA